MKRVRRISVEIERREVTFSLTRTSGGAASASPAEAPEVRSRQVTFNESTPGIGDSPVPAVCPFCGADWVFAMVELGEPSSASVVSLQSALRQLGLHLHVSATGEFRICSKSFEAIKEKL